MSFFKDGLDGDWRSESCDAFRGVGVAIEATLDDIEERGGKL